MNTSSLQRSLIVSAAALTALFTLPATVAALHPGLDVLGSGTQAPDSLLPRHAKAQSGVVGVLNASALSAPALTLTLADGRKIEARLQRVASDAKKGTQSWIGTFDDSPESILVLTRSKGVVAGFANYKDQTLEILPVAAGKHLLYAVDNGGLPAVGEAQRPPKVSGDSAGVATSDFGLGAAVPDAAAAGVVQDLLVVYTAASSARYGQAALESMIVSAVQAANQAYQNSQVAITLNLAGLQQVSLTEGSSQLATLQKLQTDSSVARLRDQVAADMVILVGENSDNCGQSYQLQSNTTAYSAYAYGAVNSSCLSNQSLAHEVGHEQGLMHDRASSSYGGAFPYSYGYRRCVSDGTGFRDVMSYPCSGAPRVLQFSNPNVTYNGYATGISYELDPANSAENARTLISTAATVASFRAGSSPAPATSPAAPSSLASQSVTYNRVSLVWKDNATNEAGFKVERSGDGVTFAEVATLGADTVAYSDGTVMAKATYYYRVRAYNSSGASGYSATVNVTTPDVTLPPAAPSQVSAANNADGTATVTWTAGSTTATSFEVRRETFDARKSVWGSAVTAATVPGNVLSIVDSAGAGTFRYSVRAVNAGGASAYTGPVQVIVTAPTPTSSNKTPPRGKKG